MRRCILLMAVVVGLAAACAGCSDSGTSQPADGSTRDQQGDARRADAGSDAPGLDAPGTGDATTADTAPSDAGASDGSRSFVVVTFNTGTTASLGHDLPPDDGYTSTHAATSDQYYGDGLAWTKAVAATTAFFAQHRPDLVVFQEIFYSGDCPSVPISARKDFVCETWKAGDPTVAQVVLGAGYQVMCHPGKPDKCAAVKKVFGRFRGCATDFCLAGLAGFKVNGCGGGARVARGVIDIAKSRGGGSITLVNVHGSSGLKSEDTKCRVKQVEQVFVDLGDGKPGASGSRNIVMGDLNTDPGRAALFDESAARWNDFVGPTKTFHFISAVGATAPPSYSGLFNIDHVISDVATGSCWTAGVTAGHPAVTSAVYFDHKPVVCKLTLP